MIKNSKSIQNLQMLKKIFHEIDLISPATPTNLEDNELIKLFLKNHFSSGMPISSVDSS